MIDLRITWIENQSQVMFVLKVAKDPEDCIKISFTCDRIPSTTPGAEPPRDAKDSGSARSHSTHLETSSSDRP